MDEKKMEPRTGNPIDVNQQPREMNPKRPEDLESQGRQKGAQQIPSSQTDIKK